MKTYDYCKTINVIDQKFSETETANYESLIEYGGLSNVKNVLFGHLYIKNYANIFLFKCTRNYKNPFFKNFMWFTNFQFFSLEEFSLLIWKILFLSLWRKTKGEPCETESQFIKSTKRICQNKLSLSDEKPHFSDLAWEEGKKLIIRSN